MVRIFAVALSILIGSAMYSVPAEAAALGGPGLKSLFSKKGVSKKAFKKSKRTKKYHIAAAKKQRRAKWQQRYPMVP